MRLMALVGTEGRADVDAVVAEILPTTPWVDAKEMGRLIDRVSVLFPHLTMDQAESMASSIYSFSRKVQ